MVQKWRDDFLGWNPDEYGGINQTILPFTPSGCPTRTSTTGTVISVRDPESVCSVVMNREETERYINVVITTNYYEGLPGAEVSGLDDGPGFYRLTNPRLWQVRFMYPALYRTSCQLNIR